MSLRRPLACLFVTDWELREKNIVKKMSVRPGLMIEGEME
jgi:hypothetical protein